MAAFAQFGSDLDKATQAQLERGKRLQELLKQDQYQPLSVEQQVAIIYAAVNGYLDKVPVAKVREFEKRFYDYCTNSAPDVLPLILQRKKLDDEVIAKLRAALDAFRDRFSALVEGA
ncbi:MAG: hypothetical protein IPJ11_16850 [Gemmatimonadetes bacterium]|nr:hypothetical protein [Gemmatimonadota bacterium]